MTYWKLLRPLLLINVSFFETQRVLEKDMKRKSFACSKVRVGSCEA